MVSLSYSAIMRKPEKRFFRTEVLVTLYAFVQERVSLVTYQLQMTKDYDVTVARL